MTDGEKITEALSIAFNYSQTDGAHHKAWVIDQMVRCLTGEAYEVWINSYRGKYSSDEEVYEYEWDEGIAP